MDILEMFMWLDELAYDEDVLLEEVILSADAQELI